MTPKELLYVEDALGHETFFGTQYAQAAAQLQDPELRACVVQMAEKHRQIYQNLYGLL